MTVIIGGAYQGKLDYAMSHMDLSTDDVEKCTKTHTPDFSKKIIYGLHQYIYYLVEKGVEVDKTALCAALEGKIIICDDITSGVVPVEPVLRKWREETGGVLALLCSKADSVIRVFYGIGTVIK